MTVEGLASLNRKLTKAIPAKVYEAVQAALSQAADDVVALMKRLVPVDHGDLRDSIAWTWGNVPKGALTLAKSKPIGNGLRISIYAGGTNAAKHAWWVEFGTQAMAAQPYFFPSWRARRRAAKSKVTRAISKGIKAGSR